jgi:Concanavalin A-like lectin/glucanases superfamily
VHTGLDNPNFSPTSSNTANISFTRTDFVAAKNCLGGAVYPDKSQIALPSGTVRPLRPYWLEPAITDRFRKAVLAAQPSAYWRCQDAPGSTGLVDEVGGYTMTAHGTPTYRATSTVPSNPSDYSVARTDDLTTYFDAGDLDLWSPATTGQMTILWCGQLDSLPTLGNAHLVAKGQASEYEFSLYVSSTNGSINFNFWIPDGSLGDDITDAFPIGEPVMLVAVYDSTRTRQSSQMKLVVNGDTANAPSGNMGLAIANRAAPLCIGRRSGATDRGPTGAFSHIAFWNKSVSDQTIQALYAAFAAAPSITNVNATVSA